MKNLLTKNRQFLGMILASLFVLVMLSCTDDNNLPGDNSQPFNNSAAVFLLMDEDAIDNGNPPNNFSDTDVNDQIATVGQRKTLQYFQNNVGQVITLYSGQVGDEGWFALKTIPSSWISAGPSANGLKNYLTPGPGLGAQGNNPEALLDEIPNVTPLRATGLTMLKGQIVYAVVYDSDISINYSPLKGNLKGANLGIVAFDVLEVTKRTDGSSSDLPKVSVRIRNTAEIANLPMHLFANAPVPQSSSDPFDITPPTTAPQITLTLAP